MLVMAALAVLLVIIPLLGNAYYSSVLIIIGIHAIVTVGLCLLMGYTGQISLGQAAFYGLGAYIAAILSKTYHINPWLAMVVAIIATAAFAFAIGFPIFRLRGNYLAMATLGLGIIIWILFRELSGITGGPVGFPGIPDLSIAGFSFNSDFRFYYLVWGFCLAINATLIKVKILALSAAYAALAGSLYAYYVGFIDPPPFGFLFSIRLVVMAVVGGLASIWGAIFGAATVRLMTEFLHPFGDIDVVLFGLILVVVIILSPQGVLRGLGDLWRRFSRRVVSG
jgi:branched-chain amino acid transport system permease protein